MSEHETFDMRLLEQRARLRAFPQPVSFDLTEEMVKSAFAQEKERADGR